jgi:endonuclease/exonuclease/phosphatase family metal-dependent hydrolase
MASKIVSINIERHKHFDRVVEFLKRENPEIVCLMEVNELDIEILAGTIYPHTVYAPNDVMPESEGRGTTGVAILSKQPIDSSDKFYCGEEDKLQLKKPGMGTHAPILILAKIGQLQIGAVHFSWTADGSVDERQRKHTGILLDYLSTKGELVLCGDFNIPRGNEMYQKIAGVYKDNIPADITTTLDPHLHRANFEMPGKLQFVVDYVWSTPKYEVSELQVVQGVSDHCGLVFSIVKN